MKPVHGLGDSKRAISAFPVKVRGVVGHELHRVQPGFEPSDWKPMKTIGPGVQELRVHIDGEWRVIDLATRPEAVYVLHALREKARQTAREDIALARQRWKLIESKVGR